MYRLSTLMTHNQESVKLYTLWLNYKHNNLPARGGDRVSSGIPFVPVYRHTVINYARFPTKQPGIPVYRRDIYLTFIPVSTLQNILIPLQTLIGANLQWKGFKSPPSHIIPVNKIEKLLPFLWHFFLLVSGLPVNSISIWIRIR